MMVVLALIVVLSAPTAVAPPPPPTDVMTAIWDDPNIVVTVKDFHNPDHWCQYRYCQPGSLSNVGPYDSTTNPGGYFVSDPWVPSKDNDPYTDRFDVTNSSAEYKGGEWTVCLYKDGVFKKGDTEPQDTPNSPRGCETVMVGDDPSIPEFTTIAIPAIAILGLFAFYRRKQKR